MTRCCPTCGAILEIVGGLPDFIGDEHAVTWCEMPAGDRLVRDLAGFCGLDNKSSRRSLADSFFTYMEWAQRIIEESEANDAD
jgi:hypothetical protein